MSSPQNDLQFSCYTDHPLSSSAHFHTNDQSALLRHCPSPLDAPPPPDPFLSVHDYSPDTKPFHHSQSPESPHASSPAARSPARSRSLNPNYIPRPRNAFMIFRSEFAAGEKIDRNIEHDHRHISRIVGHIWNKMSESEKDVWRRKAEDEKVDHLRRYPGYRFCPSIRLKPPSRRNVKRNSIEELVRCERVADLLMSGKQGEELANAVKSISPVASSISTSPEAKKKRRKYPSTSHSLGTRKPTATPLREADSPVFLSPLLPPSNTLERSVSPDSGTSSSTNSGIKCYSYQVRADSTDIVTNELNSRDDDARISLLSSSGIQDPQYTNAFIHSMSLESPFYALNPMPLSHAESSPFPTSVEAYYYSHSLLNSQRNITYPSGFS